MVGGESGGQRVEGEVVDGGGWSRETLWINPMASSENRVSERPAILQ